MSTKHKRKHSHTVAQAIAKYAPNQHVAEAMGLGALMEGGSLGAGPWNAGDFGHSRGPFQENDMYHNYNVRRINNPDYAVRYIMPAYVRAAKSVPQELWDSNPERAAELTAFRAERPAKDYYQTEDVHAKWLALKGKVPGLSHEDFRLSADSSGTGGLPSTIGGYSLTLVLVVVVVLILVIRK